MKLVKLLLAKNAEPNPIFLENKNLIDCLISRKPKDELKMSVIVNNLLNYSLADLHINERFDKLHSYKKVTEESALYRIGTVIEKHIKKLDRRLQYLIKGI